MRKLPLMAFTGFALLACAENSKTQNFPGDKWLTGMQKQHLMAITSTFENGDPSLAFDYIENLDDGRGYTAGYLGFCSGTGDMLDFVEHYTDKTPGNALGAYLPALRKINSGISDDSPNPSTKGLGSKFVNAWQSSARTPAMQQAQLDVGDSTYYLPAMQRAAKYGVKLPLSLAVFYDTIVMHGDGDDLDSLGAIIHQTLLRSHGKTPLGGYNEEQWMRLFLSERKKILAHAHDPDSREEWASNTARADILSEFYDDDSFVQLSGPLHFDNTYYTGIVP